MNITVQRFEDEEHYCDKCKSDLTEEQIDLDTWTCEECGERVWIKNYSDNHTVPIVRLLPSHLSRFDSVFDWCSKEYKSLKGIQEVNGLFKLGIAGYGTDEVNANQFVNCMWRGQI